MGIWIIMLIATLLTPIIMIGFGSLFAKKAPAKINNFYGYRTPMSRKNMDTWVVAHNYSGNLMRKYGWILLPISAIAMFFVIDKEEEVVAIFGTIIVGVQIFFIFLSIFFTERMLRKIFDKEGNRRDLNENS